MRATTEAYKIIRHFEGCKYDAYLCPAGKWTIGYGHTGLDVKEGLTITHEQADAMLSLDVAKCEDALNTFVSVPLNQNQYNALISWVFNLGRENLRNSTLLRELNQGYYLKAALEIERWNKAGGKTLKGLILRRCAEVSLFLSPCKELPSLN